MPMQLLSPFSAKQTLPAKDFTLQSRSITSNPSLQQFAKVAPTARKPNLCHPPIVSPLNFPNAPSRKICHELSRCHVDRDRSTTRKLHHPCPPKCDTCTIAYLFHSDRPLNFCHCFHLVRFSLNDTLHSNQSHVLNRSLVCNLNFLAFHGRFKISEKARASSERSQSGIKCGG